MKVNSSVLMAIVAATVLVAFGGCSSNRETSEVDTTQSASSSPYSGSEACKTCHLTIYNDFMQNGHQYKLNNIVDGMVPTYPFSSIAGALEKVTDEDGITDNTLGTPTSYDDISFVIGGFGWKARWIDANGFIVTGSTVQYNLVDGSYSSYHDGDVDVPYNCGNCHTTGWKHVDADLNPVGQDGLPGMEGTFLFGGGVHCESCHGGGTAHIASQSADDIVRVATARSVDDFLASDMAFGKAVACSECHTRDGEKDYPTYVSPLQTVAPQYTEGGRIAASSGLIKHHEQYDEMLGVDPDTNEAMGRHIALGFSCTSCHDPHKTIKYQDTTGESGLVKECIDCHGDLPMPADSAMGSFDCKECHMPKLVKSAIKTVVAPDGSSGPDLGDIKTHIMKINLTQASQFTADGKFAYPAITKSFACDTCHNGVDVMEVTVASDYTFHQATEANYVGSATCGTCHQEVYAKFMNNGHQYKLNKVADGQVPTYPFSTIEGALELVTDEDGITDNTLGTPGSYADISYVIGGFGWKARWIDLDGFIVTGSTVQYNLADGSYSSYHDDGVDVPYNCGNCHTTGWKHVDEDLNPTGQDGLPGMDGTFVLEGGVQCEACHGAGSKHAASRKASDIVEIATARTTSDLMADDMGFGKAQACSECHTRDGEKDYPTYVSAYNVAFPDGSQEGGRIAASGGFVKHHEQFDEFQGVDPDTGEAMGAHLLNGLTCISCHDPHSTTKYQDVSGDVPGVEVDCSSCHTKTFTIADHGTFECDECHMPRLAKSAIKTDGANGVDTFGDIRSHIMKIDLSQTKQFTDAGDFAYPWVTGDFACGFCHADVDEHVGELPAEGVHPDS